MSNTNKELSAQVEYEKYLAIYMSMQFLPVYMRSQYFENYFNELDKRLDEVGAAIRMSQRPVLFEDAVDDNLSCQLSELENL